MGTWYMAVNYLNTIEQIEVIKETKHFISNKKNRYKKITESSACFKTKKECILWKIEQFDNEIKKLKKQISYIKENKENFINSIKRK